MRRKKIKVVQCRWVKGKGRRKNCVCTVTDRKGVFLTSFAPHAYCRNRTHRYRYDPLL
jgi:hypothetical protein